MKSRGTLEVVRSTIRALTIWALSGFSVFVLCENESVAAPSINQTDISISKDGENIAFSAYNFPENGKNAIIITGAKDDSITLIESTDRFLVHDPKFSPHIDSEILFTENHLSKEVGVGVDVVRYNLETKEKEIIETGIFHDIELYRSYPGYLSNGEGVFFATSTVNRFNGKFRFGGGFLSIKHFNQTKTILFPNSFPRNAFTHINEIVSLEDDIFFSANVGNSRAANYIDGFEKREIGHFLKYTINSKFAKMVPMDDNVISISAMCRKSDIEILLIANIKKSEKNIEYDYPQKKGIFNTETGVFEFSDYLDKNEYIRRMDCANIDGILRVAYIGTRKNEGEFISIKENGLEIKQIKERDISGFFKK
ncbi:MAG: hypothetical protein JJ959_11680 [Nisaea sp.]|uniref:hypothetical protein n=1 Tax=Nisaea sp. TaxID=2024842 RepID=UPI001B2C8860|nr:hypothetical protein [Nisaea sp.]MBO6561193.1 hypothetical protein [Nisaea sp.]